MGIEDRRRQHAIETAILETVLYSDLFDYPLTHSEIAHYLIGLKADAAEVRVCLASPRALNGHLLQVDEYVVVGKREMLVERRRVREVASNRLWRRARRFVRVLGAFPFVRMVAVTGALAMNNSMHGDDIDVLIVTARGRVWTARLFSVLLVYIGKFFGDVLCPNYVITEDALELAQRDLFTAHEFAQMTPLYGCGLYERMCEMNRWVYEYLPNADAPFRAEPEVRSGPCGRVFKRGMEMLLGGRWGDALERWEMRRKQRKFAHHMSLKSSAVLDEYQVKGHFVDYRQEILRLYQARLDKYAIRDLERV